jgi:hypothetical protein
LEFLDLLPLTLFEDAPDDPEAYDKFFEETFTLFVACLMTDDERIRFLAGTVTRKLVEYGSVFLLRKSRESGSETFHQNFWRST